MNELYFEWMYQLVCNRNVIGRLSYRKLCEKLHSIEFTYTIPRDGNRYEDGIDLRYEYGYENHISHNVIAQELDIRSCSVLEMMVALAFKCEKQIMDNIDIGDRTGKWFMDMIVSLGLERETDDKFNEKRVDYIIQRFLNHEYEHDGQGGLFTVINSPIDLRNEEIFVQENLYLNEIVKGEYGHE